MIDVPTLESPDAPNVQPGDDVKVVEASIDIAASPERVFAALTDAQELAAWWGSDDTYRTSDWKIDARHDGEWSARTIDSAGHEGSIRGTFTVADCPNVLESTWRASWDDIGTTVRYDLTPVIIDDTPGTRLTVTHTAFNGFTACANVASYARMLGMLMEFVVPLRPSSRHAQAWLGTMDEDIGTACTFAGVVCAG